MSAEPTIRPQERAIVFSLSVHSFFLGAGSTFFMSAAFALFLTDFSARELPYVYLAVAVLVPPFGSLLGILQRRTPFRIAQLANVGAMLALILASLVMIVSGRPRPVVFLLPVIVELLLASFSLGFWPLASRLFDMQQAKRLFPMLGSGLRLGAIVGGLGTVVLIEPIGSVGLIAVASGAYLLALVTLAGILARNARALGVASPSAGTRETPAVAEGMRSLLSSRFILLMVLFAALPSIAYNLIDFMFLQSIELRFDTEMAVGSFLGGFRSVQNILMLVCLLFIGGRLMSRYGVRFGLLAKPALLLALLVPALALGFFPEASGALFWILVALKLMDVLMRFVFELPATHVLKLALPEPRLVRVNGIVESGVRPVMNGIGGLAILGVQAIAPDAGTPVRILLLGLVLVWLLVALRLSTEYGTALVDALRRRTVGDSPFTITDATTAQLLRARAAAANPREALYALRLLEKGEYADLESAFAEALRHPSAVVRKQALMATQRLELTSLAGSVETLIRDDPAGDVRACALRARSALAGDAVALARQSYEAGDPAVRAEALALLARDLAEAPAATGELKRLLLDEDPLVRLLAMGAAARTHDPELLAQVADHLHIPQDRRAAAAALAEAGDPALPPLEPFLRSEVAEAGSTLPTVTQAVHACARIGSETALAILASHLDHRSRAVRRRLIAALRLEGYSPAGDEHSWVLERLDAELEEVLQVLAALRALQDVPGAEAFACGLANYALAASARILGLLAISAPQRAVASVELGLRSASPRQRALAREILEIRLPAKYSTLVSLLAVEDRSPAGLLALATGEERSSDLTALELPPWLQALARSASNEGEVMDPTIENLLFLKATSIFSEVDEEDLTEIARMLEPVELRSGETVFEDGEPARYIFFVMSGRVEFTGPRGLKKQFGAGESLGEVAVLARIDYVGTTTCLEDCRLLRLDGLTFADLMVQNGAVAYGIIGQLLERVFYLGRELGFELPEAQTGGS